MTLVLVDERGAVLGSLPPFEAATPWWQDIGPVVDGARERFAVDVTVLRLLRADRPHPPGGAVTYLAEPDRGRLRRPGPGVGALAPWAGDLPDDPLRQTWARPGGPDADLAWADTVLAAIGRPRVGGHSRSARGTSRACGGSRPPAARRGSRSSRRSSRTRARCSTRSRAGRWPSLACSGATARGRCSTRCPATTATTPRSPNGSRMVDGLVRLQAAWSTRTAELLGLGLPDWRGPALTGAIAALVERERDGLDGRDRATLGAFVADLPARFAALAACGLPDTLVHGDFHPGNVRGDGTTMTLLDWGDAGVGHPLLDQPAFLAVIDDADVDAVATRWAAAWRSAVPDRSPSAPRPSSRPSPPRARP